MRGPGYDPGRMHRSIVAAVAITALVGAGTAVWLDARQEAEYRRLLTLGDVAVGRGQVSEAIEAFSGALTLKPDSMIARLKRGDTYRQRREFASAVRDLREAVALDPTAPRPLELLGDAHAAMGQLEAATLDYQRCLRLEDRAPRVAYKLGVVHYRNGKVSDAVETLQRAVDLDDRLAEAHYALALALKDSQPPARSERALRRALELDPTLAAAREELVSLYARTGRYRQVIEELEALAALEPARPERLVSVALAYAKLGRRDAAVLTLGRAAERHPDAPIVYTALGRVWLDEAESQGDRAAVQKAVRALAPLATQPTASSEALSMYGRALYLSGSISAAELMLRRATQQMPVHPQAFAYLAAAARRLGHTDEARHAEARYAALTSG